MIYSAMTRERSRGFSVYELLVMVGIFGVLAGLVFQGSVWIKSHADLAVLTSRCQNLGTALQLYYQKHRSFPDAFPAHLEQDLAAYIPDEAFFTCSANPAARAAPLNASYVTPVLGYKNAYVLGLDTRFDEDVSVVLFSNLTTEVVEKLPVLHNLEPIILGNRATEGTITFASGSEVQLNSNTTATVVNSFRSADGTPFNVVTFDKGVGSSAQLTAVGSDIIQLVSYPGTAFLRGGTADALTTTGESADELRVSTQSGEVRLIGRTMARAPSAQDEEADAGGAGLAVSGRVNLNPLNSAFRFTLKKLDGTYITREDMLASRRQLEYFGPVCWVIFRPKGNGNQNALIVNGDAYPVDNARLYVLIGTDISVRLYNDQKLSVKRGNGMGRWWLDSISATDARVIPLDWDTGDLPPEEDFDDYYDLPPTPEPEAPPRRSR